MAARYFIGTGNRNWNDTANWSATSGGVGGASVPTMNDDVYFDSNSGTGTVTVNAIANMRDCTFAQTQLITLANAAYAFNIYGNWTLCSNTYLNTSFTGTGSVYLKATTSVNITSNGCTRAWNRLYFDGVGGTWTNQDDWSVGSTSLLLINGEYYSNNYTITSGGYQGLNRVTGKIYFGSSIINCINIVNFTVNSLDVGTSIVTLTSFQIGGINWNVVNVIGIQLVISGGGGSIRELNIIGTGVSTLQFYINISITDILTFQGLNSTTQRLLVYSNSLGTHRTITCNGTVTASNVDFRDIVGAGTANWDLSAIDGGSGDCGGNSGITFTPAQTQYFKHTSGSVNWSDATKWFSNYERTIAGRVPLPQDDAIFDENSFTGASTLTVNVPRIGGLNMEGVNKVVTFNRFGSTLYEMYKSVNIPNTNVSFGYGSVQLPMHMYGRGYFIFHCKPKTGEIRFYSGTYTVSSDVTAVAYFHAWGIGTVYLGGNYIKTPYFRVSDTNKMYCENAIIEVNATSEYGVLVNSPNFYAGNSTVRITATGAALVAVNGNLIVFNILHFSGLHTGNYDITGNNIFAELIIDSGRKVRLKPNTTQTISKLTAIGTPDKPITIGSTTPGSKYTLNLTGTEPIETDYINITDCNITQTNKFYAGVNSINGGNNTNVIFDYAELPLNMNLYTLKMYDKVLTDEEVLQNYNATKSRYI